MRAIRTIKDVVDWRLCTGCGACAYACSENAVSLVNVECVGIRPQFNSPGCAECTKCLDICPGYSIDTAKADTSLPITTEADRSFGPALEVWEGFATDPALRFRASSGGLLTALALYCLEQEGMKFVLHTGMNSARPWENQTIKSFNRQELESRMGSRYAPSSPCEGLSEIEDSDGPCVFIGKPCDTAAVAMLRRDRPKLDENLGLVMTFFCAGTPSSQGTLELARSLDVLPSDISSVKYRGEGWPGEFTIVHGEDKKQESLSYAESWGRLAKFRSLRCNLCPDGLGRLADISCGDAWEKSSEQSAGTSLILVRTARGQRILREAIAARYVKLVPANSDNVFAAQANLLERRRELFGRLLALRLLLLPVPRFRGFFLLRGWGALPTKHKVKTILGTVRRAVRRSLHRRLVLNTAHPHDRKQIGDAVDSLRKKNIP